MEKRVAIVGAGISGLLACKYTIESGFQPVVFEAQGGIGGVWSEAMESTKLQNPRDAFQFSDFPWPPSVQDFHPSHTQVMDYIESYAQHFNLFPYSRCNSKVISMIYVGVSEEEMQSWDLWGRTGNPFSSRGKWHLKVHDNIRCCTEEYQYEFVILCIGKYSGLPNIPEFPPDHSPQVYNGKVVHSMDYCAMDNKNVSELVKGKRIAIIGSQKSALDIAAECANVNGLDYPCTMIQRFLATLLSPLRWATSKLVESYLTWELPLKKYKMVPKHSFLEQFSSCQVPLLPDNFYRKVEEGSIVLKKSQSMSFCSEGLIVDGEVKPLKTDLVILATGFKGDEKLKNMFTSPTFPKFIQGPTTTQVPLYRQIIQPRIPSLAVVGYLETLSNLQGSEIQCQWLTHLLCQTFELPSNRAMENEIEQWENYMKRYAGKSYSRSCIAIPKWYNDQLCRDMGCETRRKKGIFAEFFEPYGPLDYIGLTRH